jgi:hypothetical protein
MNSANGTASKTFTFGSQWSETRDREQKKRARRRTRILLALLGLVLVGLAIASLEFYRLKSEADIERVDALQARARADKSALEAANQRKVANAREDEAQEQKQIAENNAGDARRQKEAAEKNAAVAQRNARESKARDLAAFSSERLSDDPEKSILLGMHAVNATVRFDQPPVSAAEDVLHQAILSSQELLICASSVKMSPSNWSTSRRASRSFAMYGEVRLQRM